jgi:hypothetical protein
VRNTKKQNVGVNTVEKCSTGYQDSVVAYWGAGKIIKMNIIYISLGMFAIIMIALWVASSCTQEWKPPRKKAPCGHIAAPDGKCDWGPGCDKKSKE